VFFFFFLLEMIYYCKIVKHEKKTKSAYLSSLFDGCFVGF